MVLLMLLLPEISKTRSDTIPLCVGEHAKILSVILRCIAAKKLKGESPSDLWLNIVRVELKWCVNYLDYLSVNHRRQACDLLEWFYSVNGSVEDNWLVLLPESEYYWRLARAELDWCAAHVNKLSRRYRLFAIDLLADFCAANPDEFRASWRIINDAEIPSR